MKRIIITLWLGIFFLLGAIAPCNANEKLTLILDWLPNPNHAPLLIAKEKGFFRQENLEVEIIAPSNPTDPPKWVAAKKADIAVTYQPQFIFLASQDVPLISIGSLINQPLDCLAVLDNSPFKSITDLKHQSIGSSTNGIAAVTLKTILEHHDLTLHDVKMIQVHFDLIQALLSKRVAAVTGMMRNIEVIQLQDMHHPARIFLPEENGVPTYSELIYVIHRDHNHEQKIKKFLRAMTKATHYLKKHPEESWQVVIKCYPTLNNKTNHRSWVVTIPYFSNNPSSYNEQDWKTFLDFMQQNKLIKTVKPVETYTVDLLKE